MMAAILQSIQNLCHGCLSADRDLSPIGKLSDMFTMICDRKARVPGLKYTSLCWECTATLKRMKSFQKQVKNAQTILKFYVRTKDKSHPKTLSRLKATRTNHNFITLIESDKPEIDIKPLDEIKEEEHHDENDSKHDDADFFAANNEEDDLTQDSAFILVVKDLKKTPRQQKDKPYCPINTAEEMCVKRQSRRKQKFLCDYCGKKYSSKLLIQRHISRHHTEHKCNQCSRTYSSYKGLRDHMSRVHNEVDRSWELYCVRCNKHYKNRQNLVYHLRHSVAHADESGKDKKSIKCLACDKCFALKHRMMEHYRYVHQGSRKYDCSICDKSFCRQDRYKSHLRYKHEGAEKPRRKICSVCGRGFHARILENHMRTHTGERPFACAVCDARFAQKVARDMHQKRHCRQNKAD